VGQGGVAAGVAGVLLFKNAGVRRLAHTGLNKSRTSGSGRPRKDRYKGSPHDSFKIVR
jgi:hypothetical protein